MNPLRVWALAGCLIAGILAADALAVPSALAATAAGLGAASIIAAAVSIRGRVPVLSEPLPRIGWAGAAAVLVGFVLCGFGNHAARLAASRDAPLRQMAGRVVQLNGKVVAEPRRVGESWALVIAVAGVEGREHRGRVELVAKRRIEVGSGVIVDARLAALREGDPFDEARARRGILLKGQMVGPPAVLGRTNNPALVAADYLRERLASAAKGGLARRQAGLLMGMTIGDESLIPDSDTEAFRVGGLSHLTAVSGANVAIVAGAVVVLVRALRRSRAVQILAALLAVALFTVVARWEPSVLRAAITSSIALAAFFFGRRTSGLHALGLAAVILLSVDPNLLWSIGAQLSFAATGAILLLGRPIATRINGWGVWRPVADASALAISAQAGVWPLVAFHFGTFSTFSLLANVAAFWLVAPITVGGFAAGLVASVHVGAGAAIAQLTSPMLRLLIAIAETTAGAPGAQMRIHRPGWGLLVLGYLLSALIVLLLLWRRRAATVFAAASLVFASASQVIAAPGPPTGAMRVTFFDVGQGDAALVETPGGARVLIDGGPQPGMVASLLSRRRIRRVDVVVFSHAHADHIAGLDEVLARFEVRRVFHPGAGDIPRGALRWGQVTAGESYRIADLDIEILAPDEPARQSANTGNEDGESSAINDASVVMRFGFGRGCALFTGDIEEMAQEDLVERAGRRLTCDVMKAPHHGSAKLTQRFVDAVSPEVVAVSVGRNRFGHPTRRALRLFERAGARVLRTDLEGDFVLEVGADGVVRRG